MSPSELRSQLETVARRLGVAVSFEPFEASLGRRGGLCKVRGETRIVVDSQGTVLEQIATLERALRRFDLEGVYVPPLLRARLDGTSTAPPRRGPDRSAPRRPAGPTVRKTRA